MDIQELRADLGYIYKTMAIGRRDLKEWEKGYVTAINEVLRKIARENSAGLTSHPTPQEKRLFDCAKSCFVALIADSKNLKRAEETAGKAYAAAKTFLSVFDAMREEDVNIENASDD